MTTIQLSPEEEPYFRQLWNILDPQGLGSTNARDTVLFFKRSQLPSDKLKSIWLLSVVNNENKLYPQEFFTALKYIAYCQNGFELSPQLLQENRPVRLPILDGIPQPQPQVQQIPLTSQIPQQQQIQLNSQIPTAQSYQTMPVVSQQQPMNQYFQPPLIQQAQQDSSALFDIGGEQLERYCQHYASQDKQQCGHIDGETARTLFQKSGLAVQVLTELWALVDTGHKGYLYKFEYIVAIHLISLCRKNIPLPDRLPDSMQKLILQSQPQQSIIINEMKPLNSQASQNSRVASGSTSASELPGLQTQQQQLQNQLTSLVQQFPNYSNNNAQKVAIDNKARELEFLIEQINKLQICFDTLKQQELDLKNEIQKNNTRYQQQQQAVIQMQQQPIQQLPPLVQSFELNQAPLYQQQQNTNYNMYPPLQSETKAPFQQINLALDDGFEKYRAQQQTEEVPW